MEMKKRMKKSVSKKGNPAKNTFAWKRYLPFLLVAFALLVLKLYLTTTVDFQCSVRHKPDAKPPVTVVSAEDYFAMGNYQYDSGDCSSAVYDYTIAIQLKPDYAQAYNNRAYTYMRMKQYTDAIVDLNRAISIRPEYVRAHINRGDLYNYYGPTIDAARALEDYDTALRIAGPSDSGVCGHRAVAIAKLPGHPGWNLLTWLQYMSMGKEKLCLLSSD
jgi:tetratricopeptide (TPR) repeat protein